MKPSGERPSESRALADMSDKSKFYARCNVTAGKRIRLGDRAISALAGT